MESFWTVGGLSKDVSEPRTSTGSGRFAFLSSYIFRGIVSIRVKTLRNTHLEASRYIKKKKASLPVNPHRSKN